MNPERWQQIDAIFKDALDCEPPSRATFLTEACQGDSTLQNEVEHLLTAYDAAGSFLETPVAASLGLDNKPMRPPALTAGQQLSHYQIVSQLGAGGMGEVYLANDLNLDRQVAIKILTSQFTQNVAQVRRFEREARAVSALNNPNIITIHEVGKDGDLHFIATEFIEGQTLRQRLANGELPLKVLINIAEQIARALSAAHAAGIVHRDIKPENVMVRPDGLVKVLDFGLAKLSDLVPTPATKSSVLSLETDGMMMGTVAYLSPEQVRRQEVDHRTDIFSLGVVLYEMLASERPFPGKSIAEVFDRIICSEPKPITSRHSSAELTRIIARALAKDPAERYESAEELRADLAAAAHKLDSARPSSWRKVAALVAGIALLVSIGLWLQTRRSASAPRLVFGAAQKLTDLPQEEMFPTLTPDGKTLVFASPQSGSWDIYRQTVGERSAVNLTMSPDSADLQPAISPDGARIAFRSFGRKSGVYVMNIDGSNVTQVTESGSNPAWSPDGSELVVNDDNIFDYEDRNTFPSASKLWAVNLATRKQRVITKRDAVQGSWSPDGSRLAFWGEQKGGRRDIWTVASDGHSEPVPVTDDGFIDWNPIWSPDGQYLYFLSNRGGEMNLWRVAIEERTGRLQSEPEPTTLPCNNCQHVSFARNGNSLVYGQSTRSENLWQIEFDPDSGEVVGTGSPLTQGLKRYTWFSLAPDEQRFVYLARGEPQQDLFTANRAGKPLQRLTDDVSQDIVPRWSPDGQWIAFLSDRSGKYEIWKVRPDGSGLAQMTHEPDRDLIAPVWSPDGTKLLYQVRNVNSYVIDAGRPGSEQTPQALGGDSPHGFIPMEWSPDGTMLVGWQPLHEKRAIVIYTFAEQRYQTFATGFGAFPIWLNDNRRVLFREGSKLFVLDRMDGKWREILALRSPSQIGRYALSRDNRRLYYTSASNEADIWLLNLETAGK